MKELPARSALCGFDLSSFDDHSQCFISFIFPSASSFSIASAFDFFLPFVRACVPFSPVHTHTNIYYYPSPNGSECDRKKMEKIRDVPEFRVSQHQNVNKIRTECCVCGSRFKNKNTQWNSRQFQGTKLEYGRALMHTMRR